MDSRGSSLPPHRHLPRTPGGAVPPAPGGSADSLAGLRRDCARMAPHWVVPAGPLAPRVPPSRIRGVTVPAASARLLGALPEYGG
ncbi:hypothetical protein ABT354_15225 [Streptomyces sp. NPDC000594]|uniref:hypothetical protein n=1 Tax=Streptomyces sp. NPDC000594 TaxID=3154261 RepID=UPI00332424E3